MLEGLTQEELKRVLSYDPETGVFRWLVKPNKRIAAGTVAGSPNGDYWQITIRGARYGAHRLAWFYVTGAWPTHLIDHEDRNGTNNRYKNLRPATKSENQQNRGTQRNQLGIKGVRFYPSSAYWPVDRYKAQLTIDGKTHQLYFATLEEAVACRQEMEKKFHPFRPSKSS